VTPPVTFPDRPLHVRIPGATWRSRIVAAIGGLVLVGLMVASFIWVAPTLWTDIQIRNTAEGVASSRIEEGSCRSKLFINICEVTLSAGKAANAVRRDVTYVFADLHMGDYTVQVLADPARPELLTTDLGLDKLPSRIITIGIFWALMLAGGVAVIRNLFRRRSVMREVESWNGQRLKPAVLQLTNVGGGTGTAHWTVTKPDGTGKYIWTVPADSRPFFLDDSHILGVTGPQGGVVAPLDYGLTWIDLTEEERAAIGRTLHPQTAHDDGGNAHPATA
jgi:hypothetical protein